MLLPQRLLRSYPMLVLLVAFFVIIVYSRFDNYPLGTVSSTKIWSKPKSATVNSKAKKPMNRPELPDGICPDNLRFLRRKSLELTDEILYRRICVKPVFSNKPYRDDITRVQEPLLSGVPARIDLPTCSSPETIPCAPLKLTVPKPHPEANGSHIVFGVATKFSRLRDSLGPFAHWMANHDAKLLAVVVDADRIEEEEDKKESEGKARDPKRTFAALEAEYAAAGIEVKLVRPRKKKWTTEQNHFAMIQDMLDLAERGPAKAKWFGVLDDDTFFPSFYNMVKMLERYNHKKSVWLGAYSEDFDAVKRWGPMAFGGAGVFLSAPLAEELGGLVETCLEDNIAPTGDGILRDCIFLHTRTKLTLVDGLYQQDTGGDVSGFFESGVLPLSLHHWKSWYHDPIPKMAGITEICGDCFLQRWRFGNDTVLANGYSIAQYADGLGHIDLRLVEGTWRNPNRDFDYSLGPLRSKLPKDKKKSWKVADTETTADGTYKQVYVYRGDWEAGEKDEVIEMVWEKPREDS